MTSLDLLFGKAKVEGAKLGGHGGRETYTACQEVGRGGGCLGRGGDPASDLQVPPPTAEGVAASESQVTALRGPHNGTWGSETGHLQEGH